MSPTVRLIGSTLFKFTFRAMLSSILSSKKTIPQLGSLEERFSNENRRANPSLQALIPSHMEGTEADDGSVVLLEGE